MPPPCKQAPTELVKSGTPKGKLKPAQQAPPLCKQCPLKAELEVYILELEEGRVYVGSSRNLDRRIDQHKGGFGSAFTKVYRPTGVRLPRLGNISGDGDAAERDETLRYMYQRGIPFVRGWKFTQVAMPPEEFEEAEANIRELFELCRKCGYKGHFITQCKATFDRWGKEC
jgi:predicted GIY-YIG superfamily endonuclease